MTVSKAVRWENIDLESAALTRQELQQVVSILKERLSNESPISHGRLKKAIKRANALINAPKPRKEKTRPEDLPSDHRPTGRYNGGMGSATFMSGGAPGSRR
ncbi:hypothetical protein [Sinorhizobium fredii]